MLRSSLQSVTAGAALLALSVGSVAAQGYRDDDAPRHYYHHQHGDEGGQCGAVVRATGIGYPFGAFSRNSAIKAWKREAEAVYGRDYAWSLARNRTIDCSPYLATIRCTAVARPCS